MISLSGKALAAGVLAIAPVALNFGPLVLGQSKSLTAAVSAFGAPVTISSAAARISEFTLSGVSFPVTIPAGSKVSAAVTFTPRASGSASDSFSFVSNASDPTALASLTGNGSAQLPAIAGPAYYVDASVGNDSNDGRSPAAAWQTIARVNRSTFQPGDSILFKNGGVWREQLNITKSGAPGNPITFGSYGSGSPPIISGADLATGWASTTVTSDATASSGTAKLWWVSEASPTNQVFEDGTRLASSTAPSVMAVGSFYYDSQTGRLYVRALSDDNPNNHSMEVSRRNYAIYEAGGSNYITLQNLQTSGAMGSDIYFNGSAFVTVSNVSATNSFGEGIRFDVVASSSIISTTVDRNGANGISADDAPDLIINGCIAHDNASLPKVDYTAGIKLNPDYPPYHPSVNVTIENSVAYGNGPGQAASNKWLGAGIWADTIASGLRILRNRVYDNNLMGIYLDADNHATAAYNVVYSNGHQGAIDGGGIAVYGDGRRITANSVYGNTVYGNFRGGIKVSGANLANGCENISVENNIATGTVSGSDFAVTGGCEKSGPNGRGNVYAYNAFGTQSPNFIEYGTRTYLSTYAAFDAAYGANTHSVTSDPLFTNASANDFTLISSSPAIGAGTNLGVNYQNALDPASAWPSHIVTANQPSDASKWDLGAYSHFHSQP